MKKIKLEDLNNLSKKDFNGTIKVIPTQLLENLESIQLPIKNKEIAIKSICNFLSYLSAKQSEYDTTLIIIDKKVFVEYFSIHTYNQFKDILKNNEVLTQVSYESGIGYNAEAGIAKQYRIHNNYLATTDFTILIFDNDKSKIETKIDANVNINFLNTIINEELDYEKVLRSEHEYYTTNQTSKFSLFVRISRALGLNTNRYIKKGSKVNRIYHSYSNLSKVTRKCFKTKFNFIDLKNSQPSLLCYYLKSNDIKFEKQYQDVCESGLFYELFYDLYPTLKGDALRKKVKVAIYDSLFFSFNTNRKVNKRFKLLFPLIWNALQTINDKGITLASILQNIEAEIFNNIELKYSNKYFTLFDAVYFNNKKDIGTISSQIKAAGKKYDIKFALEINDEMDKINLEPQHIITIEETPKVAVKLISRKKYDAFLQQAYPKTQGLKFYRVNKQNILNELVELQTKDDNEIEAIIKKYNN